VPNRLFIFLNGKFRLREKDNKREWQPYNWIQKLREHMSDRSEEDRARPWELKSIHDVITDREDRSDPSPDDIFENQDYKTDRDNDGETGR